MKINLEIPDIEVKKTATKGADDGESSSFPAWLIILVILAVFGFQFGFKGLPSGSGSGQSQTIIINN